MPSKITCFWLEPTLLVQVSFRRYSSDGAPAWPPFDDLDIAALRAAQVALQADPFSDDAKAVIARIIAAMPR